MTSPVLIVGAGPVGLTLASELTRYGVAVRIVDQAAQRTDKSKAMVLWSRTLELLDRGGGADGSTPFVAAGLKLSGVTMMRGDDAIGRVSMDNVQSPHAYALALPQSDTERLLEERLATQGVTVERSVQADAFSFGADGVGVRLATSDGRREEVRADWLVGCDGAHSAVRHALAVPFAGKTLASDWFLADVHMHGYPRQDSEGTIYWHEDGVLIILPIQPGRYRIIGDLPATAGASPATPSLAEVQAMIDRRGPRGTEVFDPVWLSGFRINDRKVAQYRYGRVFLAGDGAHIHSPAGGQGMNTGMQDAFNLAWKLALVVRGRAAESLLDSYTPERSRVGDEVLKAAARLTAVATLKNPIVQRLRNIVGHMLLGWPPVAHALADQMAEVSIHYPDSPLNGPYAGTGIRPGERVPPPADGLLTASTGNEPRFALHGVADAVLLTIAVQFNGLVDPKVRSPLTDGTVSLVRPDGYLACSARQPSEIAAYLGALRNGCPYSESRKK